MIQPSVKKVKYGQFKSLQSHDYMTQTNASSLASKRTHFSDRMSRLSPVSDADRENSLTTRVVNIKCKKVNYAENPSQPRRSQRVKTSDKPKKQSPKPSPQEINQPSTTPDKFECFVCCSLLQCTETEFLGHLDTCLDLAENDAEEIPEIIVLDDSDQSPRDIPEASKDIRMPEENEEVDVDALDDNFGKPQFTSEELQGFYPKGIPVIKHTTRPQNVNMSESDLGTTSTLTLPSHASHGLHPPLTTSVPDLIQDVSSSSVTSFSSEPVKEDTCSETAVCSPENQHHSIDALKAEIQRLKATQIPPTGPGSFCLICYEGFQEPLVSVGCWHVYCRGCWFQTMGFKKLCPQCNRITFPEDLRRIYL